MTAANRISRPFIVQLVDWSDYSEPLSRVRTEVFVVEQNVPEALEMDGLDRECVHAAAIGDDTVIGTGRLLPDGRIGRMAVVRGWRGTGVGGAILATLIEAARRQGHQQVRLASQVDAVGFYQHHGFHPSAEIFMDAGIPHRAMTRDL